MKSFRPAILFFSYSVARQARMKRWFGDDQSRNEGLAHRLISRSLAVLRRSGLPVFHFDEGRQQGDSFGERLGNACTELFTQGFDAVIAVGNDNPGIHHTNWEEVVQALESGMPVLGPDKRGGVYLIGLTRSMHAGGYLENIPWNSRCVRQHLQNKGQAFMLTEQRDLNTGRDLWLFLNESASHHWLTGFFRSPVPSPLSHRHQLPGVVAGTHTLRGPPA